MRINGVTKHEIEVFVVTLSGKNLSIRQIEQLAQGYFRGSESFRQEFNSGHIDLSLAECRHDNTTGCNTFEQGVIKDLTYTSKFMQRVMDAGQDRRLKTPAFNAQANLLTKQILDKSNLFIQTIRQLHDRSR